jgi:cytochrome c-type biogenesis protein CcmF
LILAVAMVVGPLLRWRRDRANEVLGGMLWPVGAAAAALILLMFLTPAIGWLPLAGLTVAAGVAVGSLAPLWRRNLRRTPLFTWGMVVAHFGIAVALAGMASDSAYTQETLVAARAGQAVRAGPYRVTLDGIAPRVGDNWSALEAHLTVRRGDSERVLLPQSRFFTDPVTTTNESAILTTWDGQLYTVLGSPDDTGRWQIRLWWKPFVTLIWLGGALIALGGLLSLIGRLRRDRAA